MNTNPLKQMIKKRQAGAAIGIYSCCSANTYVIEAALLAAKRDSSCVLIEATANQVDQFGGYTGMTPAAFYQFVHQRAKQLGVPKERIFLGGDHLGPLTFAKQKEVDAMQAAAELVRAYVLAGFTKIHIDTSMRLKDDPVSQPLSDDVIARRGAYLIKVCDEAYQERLCKVADAVAPLYVIGSEVPIPGGAQHNETLQITKPKDLHASIQSFQAAFAQQGIMDRWEDVIAFVVQPGVEEKDDGCSEYDRVKAKALMESLHAYPNLVYEGHSTDYQTSMKLREMVEDGVGILKVGPALTYALREALFALSYIESLTMHHQPEQTSHFIECLEEAMKQTPKYWQTHYHGNMPQQWLKRKFSFSDRCRYYLNDPLVEAAQAKLIANLRQTKISFSLLSQFMPNQYQKVRNHQLSADPHDLIIDHIMETIDDYLYATHQNQLFESFPV